MPFTVLRLAAAQLKSPMGPCCQAPCLRSKDYLSLACCRWWLLQKAACGAEVAGSGPGDVGTARKYDMLLSMLKDALRQPGVRVRCLPLPV